MQIKRDYYSNLEIPDFVLCKANRERIGVIPCTEKTVNFNFGDMNEINFTTFYMMDGEINPIYSSIEVMKYIWVPDVGFFYIQTCNVQSSGSEHEYKEVTALSYEGLLGQKYLENFKINTGETGSKELEFDDTGATHIHIWLSPSEKIATGQKDLFDYILEKSPDWYVSYVDPVLLEDERSHRSFDIDRQDAYSFIMDNVQDAFECYVEFDTVHTDNKGRCPISIYAQENYKYDTDIYVSYDNLLKSTNISCSTDDIKTCVVLEGEDELEIREINFGYDRIYNFDYYNNTDFWSQRLYEEYNTWHDKTYTVGRIIYQKLDDTATYDSSKIYYYYSDDSYIQDTTVTPDNFDSKVTEGLYIEQRNPNVYTEDITDNQLKNMSYLDLYQYRLKKYLEAKTELNDLNVLTSEFVNDEDRGIGSGKFPVFNDDGEEIGSIEFEPDIGVRVTEHLPSRPIVGEENFIYILKDTADIDITAIKNQLSILQNGQNYKTISHSPVAAVNSSNIYKLQNKFYETVSYNRKVLIDKLRKLEADGSVDLLLRPVIDANKLALVGWEDVGEGVATIFSSTYSNEAGNIVMNFTPIQADEYGNLIKIFSPNQLQKYAEEVIWNYEHNFYREKIDGRWEKVHKLYDPYKLKIGKTFSNINAAVNEAELIHNLHEQYFGTDAYWGYFNKNIIYNGNNVKVINTDIFINTVRNELRDVERYIQTHQEKYHYNKIHYDDLYPLDYRNYNDALKRAKILKTIINNLIIWTPIPDTYTITSAFGNSLIGLDNSFSKLLTLVNSNYEINNLPQYLNLLDSNINSRKQQLEVARATSFVTYPGYKIYRWFDNTNTSTFYNALVSANNSYETSQTISVADATTLRDYNPLYNTCLIIGSSTVDISRPNDFEEYLEADLTEQTALIKKFPQSTWFNTNDWQGYGYSELTDTWALTVDQELTVLKKDNKGNVPDAYKDAEIDSADHFWKADSTPDEKSAWYYFGEYLPCYLTQLAIEEQISVLDTQINGYETYPYVLTSKGEISFNELPTNNNNQGDTYTITNEFVLNDAEYPKGTNVTWNGTEWIITSSISIHIDGIQDRIDKQAEYKAQVVNEIQLDNNLTEPSRIELSAFIREEELTSDNFIVTDVMTEEERQEMLNSFLEYGEKELSKICIPQLTFTADIVNLFSIPEFDSISEGFEPGKTIHVSLRDDFDVKATLLTVHVNYFDPTDFTMTFSDIKKKSEGLYTDLQDAINTATSAATSVAIGSSSWSAGASTATEIYSTLQDGLLSQGAYLKDNPAKSTFVIDETGIFVDTASGDYGKYDVFGEEKYVYDSIYIGGGRILFTDDGWQHVRMSLGRSKVTRISPTNPNGFTSEEFGVYADFVISGYIAGSQICGGELYSSKFTTNKNGSRVPVSYWNLNNGRLTIYDSSGGNDPIFDFNGTKLSISGEIKASSGEIGGFKITESSLYNTKASLDDATNGVYIGTDGIALGKKDSGSAFKVASDGTLTATKGTFSGSISGGSISIPANNSKFTVDSSGNVTASSISIKGGSISIGSNFSVDSSGNLTATNANITGTITSSNANLTGSKIGGWTINNSTISSVNNLLTLDSSTARIYIGNNSNVYLEPAWMTSNYGMYLNGEFKCPVLTVTGSLECSQTSIFNGQAHFYTYITSDNGCIRFINYNNDAVGFWQSDDNTISVTSNTNWGNMNDTGKLRANITNTSDLRYKKVVDEEMTFSKDFIMNLKPFVYKWDNYGDDIQTHMGFGAQQVEYVLEFLEKYDYGVVDIPNNSNSTWGLSYHEIIAPLVKLVQTQQNKLEELEAEIERIKIKNA